MTQATMERPSTAPANTDAPIDPAGAPLPAMPAPEPRYQLIIDETVVEKISAKATQHIDGIIDMKGNLLARVQEGLGGDAQTKGVAADVIDDHYVRIDLDIILEYGKSATEVFDKIKETVGKDIDKMTGLNVAEMTVNVVDVMSKDEYASRSGNMADNGQGDAPRHVS
ncbi:Asp23/Gls24 family envelope stress response protein [Gordonibacter sp.]|uniref:Asp23/Gls24 family envelope stress response protein n=1 Tax=Gordonibacter sp. TaxID=1968902 RepID=UPI002FC5B9C0